MMQTMMTWKMKQGGLGNTTPKALLLMQRLPRCLRPHEQIIASIGPKRHLHLFALSSSSCQCRSSSYKDHRQYRLQHHEHKQLFMPVSCLNNGNLDSERKQQQYQRRCFSDNLLGYSPMAKPNTNSTPSSSNTNKDGGDQQQQKRIPTSLETTAGGVWAPTSSKRDKLAELKIALEEGQETLDDAATPVQLEDLFLADGIKLIVKITDSVPLSDDVDGVDSSRTMYTSKEISELSDFLLQQQQSLQPGEDAVDKFELEKILTKIIDKVTNLLTTYPPGRCMGQIRDFYDPDDIPSEDYTNFIQDEKDATTIGDEDSNFQDAVIRFRLLLIRAAAEHLKEDSTWKILTTLSDGDIDRAATKGQVLEAESQTVSLSKVLKFLWSNVSETCEQRVDTSWALLDRDDDGLLDQTEMDSVAFLTLKPVQTAIPLLFEEAMDNVPSVEGDGITKTTEETKEENETENSQEPKPKGWRQRRRDAKHKKRMMKMITNSCSNHFIDEVEVNHRLRCIYAWADKHHQDNKLDSVLVEEDGGVAGIVGGGRKRYVELAPKISLEEFREVQKVHFTHLDRMGEEIMKSFREDLWVHQGKGRQNRELIRDCAAFLAVVSLFDFIILSL